eukprot:g5059.t1
MDTGAATKVDVSSRATHGARLTFSVGGMTCSTCSTSIERRLKAEEDVHTCVVSLMLAEARIEVCTDADSVISGSSATESQKVRLVKRFKDIIEGIGFEADLKSVKGMRDDENRIEKDVQIAGHVGHDIARVLEREVSLLKGVQSVSVDLSTGKVRVIYMRHQTGLRKIVDVITETSGGANVTVIQSKETGWDRMVAVQTKELRAYQIRFAFSAIFAVPLLIYSMILMRIDSVHSASMNVVSGELTVGAVVMWVLATPVQFVSGAKFYVETYKSIAAGTLGMSALITVGTTAAYAYSTAYAIMMWTGTVMRHNMDGVHFFETSAVLICLVLFGKMLQSRAKSSTNDAIRHLMDMQPESAVLVKCKGYDDDDDDDDGEDGEGFVVEAERVISVSLLESGDVVKVVPGTKIPADGIVLS